MKKVIFYSWQSDTPSKVNRGFLKEILEEACKAIASDTNIDEATRDLSVDSDTQGIAGQPPIVDTIFKKIDSSAIFVADMTFTGVRKDGRPTPNPNVLIEYGWALKSLKHERVICIMNEEYGEASAESLPFDLAHLRWPIRYKLSEDSKTEDKKGVREKLVSIFTEALRASLGTIPKPTAEIKPTMVETVKGLLADPSSTIKFDDYINDHLEKYISTINVENYPTADDHSGMNVPNNTTVVERIKRYDQQSEDIGLLVATLTKWIKPEQVGLLERIFIRISESEKKSKTGSDFYMWQELAWYPVFRVIYFAGISAIVNNRYDVLALLSKLYIHDDKHGDGEKFPLIPHVCTSLTGRTSHDGFKMLPGHERKYTPRSEHLFDTLKKSIQDLFKISDKEYERCFDIFEVMLALICFDQGLGWAPIGRFGWKYRSGKNYLKNMEEDATREVDNWPPIKGGLFRGSVDRFKKVKKEFEEQMLNRTRNWD